MVIALFLVLVLGAVSCGDDAKSSDATTGSTTTVTIPSTSTTQPQAAPTELLGRWAGTRKGQAVTLSIGERFYQIHVEGSLGGVTGRLEFAKNTIRFTSTLGGCSNVGVYRWSVNGHRLTLTPIGKDLCVQRAGGLSERMFTATT